MIDVVSAPKDSIEAVKSTNRGLEDQLGGIQGKVEVVYNKGRSNEKVLTVEGGDEFGRKPNAFTAAARARVLNNLYDNDTVSGNVFRFIALSDNDNAIAAGVSTLTALEDEITVTTTGLQRVLIDTRDYTDTTNEVTLTHEFTCGTQGTDNVQKAAIFDQVTVGGTMSNILTFSPTNMSEDDTLTITWTITLG